MNKFIKISLLVFFVLTFLYPVEVFSSDTGEVLVTLRVKQEKIGNLVGIIKQQTGYTVKLDKKAAALSVTGFFDSVGIDDFFKRAFKGKNIFIIRDDTLKTILVKQVASSSKQFIATHGDNQLEMSTGMKSNSVLADRVFGTNMTMAELDGIASRNAKLYEISKSNPNVSVFGTMLTKSQLDSTGSLNKKIYDAEREDQDAVILGSSTKKSDILAEGKKNFRIYEAERTNQDSKVFGTSIKKSDSISIARKNYEIYKAMKSDPNQTVFGTNMTFAELDAVTSVNRK